MEDPPSPIPEQVVVEPAPELEPAFELAPEIRTEILRVFNRILDDIKYALDIWLSHDLDPDPEFYIPISWRLRHFTPGWTAHLIAQLRQKCTEMGLFSRIGHLGPIDTPITVGDEVYLICKWDVVEPVPAATVIVHAPYPLAQDNDLAEAPFDPVPFTPAPFTPAT